MQLLREERQEKKRRQGEGVRRASSGTNFAVARDSKLNSVSRSREKKGDMSRGCTGFASKVPLKRPPLFLRGIGT